MWIFGDVTYGIRAQVQTLGLKWLSARKQKYKVWILIYDFKCCCTEYFWIRFAGMEGLEEYVEERSTLNEQNNSWKEHAKEGITNNSSELLQTIKDLKTEIETVKKENERILRAQEEMNQILLEKFYNE